MQNQKTNHASRSICITVLLILCMCCLIFLEACSGIPKEEEPIVAEAQTPTPTLTPEPTATPQAPSETPFPTETPSPTPTPTPEPTPTPVPQETPAPTNDIDPYPELYADNPAQVFAPLEEKVIYLTFDDGPSTSTPELLDVLKDEGVAATFFVVGKSAYKQELLKRIHEEGHTLGVHTMTHDYSTIYRNLDAYLADFSREYYQIWDTTGYCPQIFRFPGGSVNSFNQHNYRELITAMNARGFVYFDWNVSSGDAAGVDDIWAQLEQLTNQSQNKNRIIALLHDTARNPHTAYVTQLYIRQMKEAGYTFKALDTTVKPIQFRY